MSYIRDLMVFTVNYIMAQTPYVSFHRAVLITYPIPWELIKGILINITRSNIWVTKLLGAFFGNVCEFTGDPDRHISCRDLTEWEGTSLVVPVMATRLTYHIVRKRLVLNFAKHSQYIFELMSCRPQECQKQLQSVLVHSYVWLKKDILNWLRPNDIYASIN